MKFSCLLNSYDSGNSLIGTNVTIGRDSTSRQYTPAQADTTYAMYVAISGNGNFTGNNVVYEQKQEYALKFKGADYTFSNFVCANAEVSTKKNTVASVAQGTNVDYTKDYIVEDERDNKYYIVRKLYMRANDGTISTACWMTQNLDTDLVAKYNSNGTTASIFAYDHENNTIRALDVNNTDFTLDEYPGSYWSTVSNANGVFLYSTASVAAVSTVTNVVSYRNAFKFETIANGASPIFPSSVSGDNSVTPSGDSNIDNTPGMIDPGNLVIGSYFNKTLSESIYGAGLETRLQFVSNRYFNNAYDLTGHVVSTNAAGNFYNWYAATAGRGNSGVTSLGTNVVDSICPKGWRLPVGGAIPAMNDIAMQISAYFPVAGIMGVDGTTVYRVGDGDTGYAYIGGSLLAENQTLFTMDPPLSYTRSSGTGPASETQSFAYSYELWSSTTGTSSYSAGKGALVFYMASTNYAPADFAAGMRGNAVTMRCVQD